MGGYLITGQEFAMVTQASSGLLRYPLSGLMGLGWQALASSGAMPFWQRLASSGNWAEQTMGFYMKRYRNQLGATSLESDGGEFTMGCVAFAWSSLLTPQLPQPVALHWRHELHRRTTYG